MLTVQLEFSPMNILEDNISCLLPQSSSVSQEKKLVLITFLDVLLCEKHGNNLTCRKVGFGIQTNIFQNIWVFFVAIQLLTNQKLFVNYDFLRW